MDVEGTVDEELFLLHALMNMSKDLIILGVILIIFSFPFSHPSLTSSQSLTRGGRDNYYP